MNKAIIFLVYRGVNTAGEMLLKAFANRTDAETWMQEEIRLSINPFHTYRITEVEVEGLFSEITPAPTDPKVETLAKELEDALPEILIDLDLEK